MTTDNIVTWATRLSIVDWVYCQTQLLLVTLRIQNQPRVNLVYFQKSNICHHQLDVQEANISLPRFNRIRNYFFGCWTEVGWYHRA